MTIDGQHQPLAVTQKVLGGESGVVEVGQIQPADIDEATRLCLMDAATSLLDTIQFRFGLSHTEIILDGDTPKIVESHGVSVAIESPIYCVSQLGMTLSSGLDSLS